MNLKLLSASLLAALALSCGCVEKMFNVGSDDTVKPEIELTEKERFHVYICFGQSNMYGSAEIQEVDKTVPCNYLMMGSSSLGTGKRALYKWDSATPPICSPSAGLSPADNFGRTMAEVGAEQDITVGVIGVAIPGCDIRLFDKELYVDYLNAFDGKKWYQDRLSDYDHNPYARIIELAKEAQKTGTIKGIILHQGETNNGQEAWLGYVEKIYNDMLRDLDLKAEDVPLVAGETAHANQDGKCAAMNAVINRLPEVIPTASVASSDGCTVNDDHVHFDSAGVRELGKRYALKMIAAQR